MIRKHQVTSRRNILTNLRILNFFTYNIEQLQRFHRDMSPENWWTWPLCAIFLTALVNEQSVSFSAEPRPKFWEPSNKFEFPSATSPKKYFPIFLPNTPSQYVVSLTCLTSSPCLTFPMSSPKTSGWSAKTFPQETLNPFSRVFNNTDLVHPPQLLNKPP